MRKAADEEERTDADDEDRVQDGEEHRDWIHTRANRKRGDAISLTLRCQVPRFDIVGSTHCEERARACFCSIRRSGIRYSALMESEPAGSERAVAVREEPIELSRLLKLAGATESGGEAKQIINDGLVRVNGDVEIRKGRKLRAGDRVTYGGETFVVEVG